MPGVDDHVSEAPTHPLAESRGVVALLLTVIPLSQIPLDAYTPAMPDMVRDLASSNTLVQNTVTVYVLGMCLALIPLGMLADSWGRKGTLLTGLLLLTIASLGCAAATEIWTLLAFRLLQGLAAATCMVVPYAVAADLFRGPQLTSISGLLGIAWGLAPVVAPAVGGLLVQYYPDGSFLLASPSWQDRLARSPSCAFRRRFPSTDECPSIRQERAKSCLLRLPTFVSLPTRPFLA